MKKQMQQGFVTFADIMGWKGIWLRNQGNEDTILTELLEIKEKIEQFIEIQSKLEDLKNIEISIKLISDTFLIYSSFKEESYPNIELEFELHSIVIKELIIYTLEKKLMIRGATSYGKYITNEMSFIGPAIDESASWHEQAESVAIFLTPTALAKTSKLNSNYWLEKNIELKQLKLATKILNWREFYKLDFEEILFGNSPIVPEIAKKYLNTLEYINEKPQTILRENNRRWFYPIQNNNRKYFGRSIWKYFQR
ncbi:hypothetical protein PJV93_04705 [Aliarcobacter butzleri]|uniref:Uncharacterized protein n=1 Tax=Aliarcobacter butzleri TaxID=28197 RepID=A0AAW7Q9T1_9BACT|nr:hypothetical protein [Aliarcobacter butzleri]MDN5075661.1 hypothetical protein [Aliarcobacter butzleri]MDN5106482.1 hypothetical protein [Aliarcobacter butzleri]MDN5123204.1 hypothetical protein [Aliarcobacter butzleri]